MLSLTDIRQDPSWVPEKRLKERERQSEYLIGMRCISSSYFSIVEALRNREKTVKICEDGESDE